MSVLMAASVAIVRQVSAPAGLGVQTASRQRSADWRTVSDDLTSVLTEGAAETETETASMKEVPSETSVISTLQISEVATSASTSSQPPKPSSATSPAEVETSEISTSESSAQLPISTSLPTTLPTMLRAPSASRDLAGLSGCGSPQALLRLAAAHHPSGRTSPTGRSDEERGGSGSYSASPTASPKAAARARRSSYLERRRSPGVSPLAGPSASPSGAQREVAQLDQLAQSLHNLELSAKAQLALGDEISAIGQANLAQPRVAHLHPQAGVDADLRDFPPEARSSSPRTYLTVGVEEQGMPMYLPLPCPSPASPARVVRGQTAPFGHPLCPPGNPRCAAQPRSGSCPSGPRASSSMRTAGSMPDLEQHGLDMCTLGATCARASTGGFPRSGLGGLGDARDARAEHSAPDLYSLELECRRAQEREESELELALLAVARKEVPALAARHFLSG